VARVAGPVFLDTTILLGGLIEFGTTEDPAHRLMGALAAGALPGALTAWHCCLEFYAVSTRLPEEYRLAGEDARVLLVEEILGRLEVRDLPEGKRLDFLYDAATLPVHGGRVYDFHIGRVALEAEARILVTENGKHFEFLTRHGVEVVGARAFLARI